jgi:MYXO-CTERM domain-containing protein
MRLLGLCLILASIAVLSPSQAEACSPPLCWAAGYVPEEGASVPANLPAIYWRPLGEYGETPDPALVTLTELAPETPIALTPTLLGNGHYLLTPARELTAGKTYRLDDTTLCRGLGDPAQISFDAAATSALPTTLGQLGSTDEGVGDLTVATGSGSCSTTIKAHRVLIALQLSSSAQPWFEALHFTTEVDGQPWSAASSIVAMRTPGTSWAGRGRDRLYLVCETDGYSQPAGGLEAGSHSVVLKATLPGTDVALQTAPITVTLSCDPLADAGPGDAQPPADAGPALDSAPPTDGTVARDASGADDGGGTGDGGGPEPSSRRGCDCATTAGHPPATALAGLALLFALARRRRG